MKKRFTIIGIVDSLVNWFMSDFNAQLIHNDDKTILSFETEKEAEEFLLEVFKRHSGSYLIVPIYSKDDSV
jgi:hypothetical protein